MYKQISDQGSSQIFPLYSKRFRVIPWPLKSRAGTGIIKNRKKGAIFPKKRNAQIAVCFKPLALPTRKRPAIRGIGFAATEALINQSHQTFPSNRFPIGRITVS